MRKSLLLPLLLLAGCSAFGSRPPTQWTRPDATPDEAAADLQSCRHYAQGKLAASQQLDQDAGADPTGQGSLGNNLAQYDTEKQYNRMISDCMHELGYLPARASP